MQNDLSNSAQVILHKLLIFNNLYSTLILFLVPKKELYQYSAV